LRAMGAQVVYARRVPEYLRVIREQYFAERFKTSPDRILLTKTCTEAFAYAAQAVIGVPGDEVIVIDTSFEPYPLLLRAMGAQVVYARRAAGGIPDPLGIDAACTDRTRAVVLILPDNPLGVVTPPPVLTQVADLCRRRDITLITDHALAEANPWGAEIPLVHELPSSRGLDWIMLGDTGKVLGLAGAKVGAIMHSGGELGERLSAKRSMWHFEFDQGQLATIAAVVGDSDRRWLPYLRQVQDQIADNYRYLQSEIRPPLTLHPMQAGCFALIDVAGTGMTGEEFAGLLQDKYGTLVIPGSVFPTGKPPGRPDTRIRAALTRTGDFNRRFLETVNEAAQC
jgi:aspartate/methionine/tyrosine aminotransferase